MKLLESGAESGASFACGVHFLHQPIGLLLQALQSIGSRGQHFLRSSGFGRGDRSNFPLRARRARLRLFLDRQGGRGIAIDRREFPDGVQTRRGVYGDTIGVRDVLGQPGESLLFAVRRVFALTRGRPIDRRRGADDGQVDTRRIFRRAEHWGRETIGRAHDQGIAELHTLYERQGGPDGEHRRRVARNSRAGYVRYRR